MSNKNTFSRLLKWLGDAGLKSLVIFILFAAGLAAYAAITWPPDVNSKTGVVGVFVGESKSAFSAGISYGATISLCDGITSPSGETIYGAHVCTPDEMVNSYNHANPQSAINTYTTAPKKLWINNGPPGYIASSNDCGGWSFASPGSDPDYPNYGTFWDFDKKYAFLTVCSTGMRFACCK